MIVIMKETLIWEKFDSMSTTIMWQETNPGQCGLLLPLIPNDKLSPCDGKFLGETSVEFEAIIEIDDKIGKNVDDMEIDELDDPDVQYQEIDTDNEGESKAEDDIRDDTNI